MAFASPSPVTFSGTASDRLRSTGNAITGAPLRAIEKAKLGARRREFIASAKMRKVKRREYPWPRDPDPNVKGGVLSHLSHFKPLTEKPKPVTLDFERPLKDLEKKIVDVRKMADETGLDFTDQILSLEEKYDQALKDLYTHLTPIQRVNIARHPNRPTFLDHVFNITEKFVELHGDRAGYDDPAIATGIGTIDGQRYMFMGHQKGRNTKENIQRNFGMPTPHGYRKALRMMHYADHHGFPIVTFIDTPGAFADLKSEELGQGEAIAQNLRTMFGLKVPIVSIVIGEGGSGGALAIGCANKLLMLENAVFYVASPEACAAILWKSAKAAPEAAEKLKITAGELCKLGVADGIIPEPLGGAHADPAWTSQQLKAAINEAMDELMKMDTEDMLKHRAQKFRKIGAFQEGIPIDPEKIVNMKKKGVTTLQKGEPDKSLDRKLEHEVEKLKQQVLEAVKSSTELPVSALKDMVEKLKKELHFEYSVAVNAMGLKDKLVMLREEASKAGNNKTLDPTLKGKIEKLSDEFNKGLSAAPNFAYLNHKLNMLKELDKAMNLLKENTKAVSLKLEINKRFREIINHPDVKEKIELIKSAIDDSGASQAEDLDDGLKEKIAVVRKEIKLKLDDALKSLGLETVHVGPKARELNKEIETRIADAVVNSPKLQSQIELLKLEAARSGETADTELKNKIENLELQIKQSLAEAISSPDLLEKFEQYKSEIKEHFGGLDGNKENLQESTVAIEVGTESSID